MNHAFTFWVTGNFTADDEKPKEEAKFSRDNWGLSMLGYITLVSNLTYRNGQRSKKLHVSV